MQAGMGITDGIIQGKISCFRNKFHKHKEKCSEKRKFLGALCLRSEQPEMAAFIMLKINGRYQKMETAEQNTKQVIEENDALKQFMELLNQQNMKEQSQDFMGIFWYVAGMQVQLSAMVDELQGVREQLSQMQEN